jgi:hypothetical protein
MGRYNIVYSLDYRIKDIIGRDFSSTFIRRIYQFTSGEMEPSVNIGSLYADCSEDFEACLQLAKTEGNHKVFQKDRNEEKSINDMLQKLELRDDIDEETKNGLTSKIFDGVCENLVTRTILYLKYPQTLILKN